MRSHAMVAGLLLLALASSTPAQAQLARTNAIWARTAPPGSITLDGNLNEAVWATAESWRVHFAYDKNHPVFGTQGIPGSGWKSEGGFPPGGFPTNDSTNATLKFLVIGSDLYLGAFVPDKSIGGGGGFNYFDGFLMGLKDHKAPGFPKPINEYMYSWWYPRELQTVSPCAQAIDSAVGNPPIFKGRWAPDPVCGPDSLPRARSAAQIAAWDARTVVNGITNSDTLIDVSYTVEMRFNLDSLGYNVTQAAGDIVEWNISIYDTDNWWKTPLTFDLSRNRTWWQNPWGRDAFHDEVRIYAKPSVTTASGAVPAIDPDFRMPTTSMAAPTINGLLNDAVWAQAPSFDIRFDDATLRAGYPTVGKWRSGQFQPRLTVNDPDPQVPLPPVEDPGDATVKYFFKGDMLYLGFDVRDLYVQSVALEDRWDGFNVTITNRDSMDAEDHNLQGQALAFMVGPTGAAVPQFHLPPLVGVGGTNVAIALKAGTVVDSTGTVNNLCVTPQLDNGYTAELAVNLTQMGYPSGLGDHTMFLGITLYDGDTFCNKPDSYGARTWWFRERQEACCPAWTYLDPTYTFGTVGVGDGPPPAGYAALGNSPNPFRLVTSLQFALGHEADVTLKVFDLGGRMVYSRALGRFPAGQQQAAMTLPAGRTGLYLYRLEAHDPATGTLTANLSGKVMHLR